jgi:hypothetical protein
VSGPIAEPQARRVRPGDWDRLRSFACSTGAWYEDEVERFVQTQLRGHYESGKANADVAVIVLAAAGVPGEILAVGAHELDPQVAEDGHHLEGTYLIVAAVRRDLQGREVDMEPFEDGRPVSVGSLLMEALIDDLPERSGVARAVVAADNARSLRLCERIGLSYERPDADHRFVQRLGRLT